MKSHADLNALFGSRKKRRTSDSGLEDLFLEVSAWWVREYLICFFFLTMSHTHWSGAQGCRCLLQVLFLSGKSSFPPPPPPPLLLSSASEDSLLEPFLALQLRLSAYLKIGVFFIFLTSFFHCKITGSVSSFLNNLSPASVQFWLFVPVGVAGDEGAGLGDGAVEQALDNFYLYIHYRTRPRTGDDPTNITGVNLVMGFPNGRAGLNSGGKKTLQQPKFRPDHYTMARALGVALVVYQYWLGECLTLAMGETMSSMTLMLPALSPKTVTLPGSPPKATTLSRTHSSAAIFEITRRTFESSEHKKT